MDDYEESEATGAWSVSSGQIAFCHRFAPLPDSSDMTHHDIFE
jgi:hypothetical protein